MAGQLIANATPELVKQLQAKIASLESQVADLTMQLLPEEDELTDKEVVELTAIMTARLAEADEEQLRLYNRPYFLRLRRPLRMIVAKALIDRAVAMKMNPLTLWHDVVALNGDMQ